MRGGVELRINRLRLIISVVVIFFSVILIYAENVDLQKDLQGLKITEIRIKTRRIKETIVRKIIVVKEGDIFNSDTIEKIRLELNRLKFFKKIDIAMEKDQAQNEAKILLDLEDGWFIFPLPFFSSGGGGSNGSLILVERNIFKRAESIFLFGGGNSDGGFGSVGFQIDRFSMSVNYGERSFTEWGYADSAFNTSGRFRSSRAEDNPEKYGAIQNQYEKKVEGEGFQMRVPLPKNIDGMFGFSSQKVSYTNPEIGILPSDQGQVNFLTAGVNIPVLKSNYGSYSDSPFSLQDFGAVFKFGMADLSQRIHQLPGIQKNISVDLSILVADKSFDSDVNFTTLNAGGQASITFTNHQRISLRMKSAMGVRNNLPLSQKIATNRELGLRGNYAREYRGDRGAGSSLSFSYAFRRTQRGIWTGDLFSDAATVWDSGRSYNKEGLGFGFRYQFWRFPLPLGFTYSYSLDDEDSQVNFAFGGRF